MKAIITGTTGYVGEGILRCCLEDSEVEQVLSVSRRPIGITHPKLEEYIVSDFMQIPEGDEKLQGYDAVFFCAGISSVGADMDYYKVVCHDIPLHFAGVVGPKEKMTFIYVSGAGTSDKAPMKWAKIKSSTEKELLSMPFRRAFGYRPALMKPHPEQVAGEKMQKATISMYPLAKFFNYANTIAEVERSMVVLSRAEDAFPKNYIGVKDIAALSKL